MALGAGWVLHERGSGVFVALRKANSISNVTAETSEKFGGYTSKTSLSLPSPHPNINSKLFDTNNNIAPIKFKARTQSRLTQNNKIKHFLWFSQIDAFSCPIIFKGRESGRGKGSGNKRTVAYRVPLPKPSGQTKRAVTPTTTLNFGILELSGGECEDCQSIGQADSPCVGAAE